MSIDSIDIQVVVDPDVVREDQKLVRSVRQAANEAKNAKEDKDHATADLNQLRWEMVACPFGPLYPVEVYAKAVGAQPRTVQKAVDAWQITVDKSDTLCAYGDGEHFGARIPLTDQQVEDHSKDKHVADVGELKAAACEMLAVHFKLSAATIKQNHRPLIDTALTRLRDAHPVDDLSIAAATILLNQIALVLNQEDKLAKRRERIVQSWMADNRGVDRDAVKLTQVRTMMQQITLLAEKRGVSWEDVEAEKRAYDAKAREAERNINEMARKAHLAILDLQEALANVKLASIAVVTSVRRIEEDGIELDADVREIATDDIDHAWAALALAKAALTGDSGTNWDNELQKLQGSDD